MKKLLTIPTLWETVRKWVQNENIQSDSTIVKFLSSDNGKTMGYPCIIYNNFEIGKFSMFRNQAYLKFFDYLEKAGGFFYERWGDAMIRSVYISFALKKDQVHYFNDLPYKHASVSTCDSRCYPKTIGMFLC